MAGTFELTPWNSEQRAILTATGENLVEALEYALRGLLAAAGASGSMHSAVPPGTVRAISIRGGGAGAAAVVTELAADVLTQLETYGLAFDRIDLDGLIRTDDGLSAWGYLRGTPGNEPRPVGVTLDGLPTVETVDDHDLISCALRRTARPMKERTGP